MFFFSNNKQMCIIPSTNDAEFQNISKKDYRLYHSIIVLMLLKYQTKTFILLNKYIMTLLIH